MCEMDEPVMTPCRHCLCRACLQGWGKKTCPSCRAPFEWHQIAAAKWIKKPEELAAEAAAEAELARLNGDVAGEAVAGDSAAAGGDGGPAPEGAPLPQAAHVPGERVLDLSIFNKPGYEFFGQKIVRLIDELAEMKRGNARAKALVFTQFMPTTINVKKALTHVGIPFASLEGSMTLRQRESALKRFLGNPDIEVFILNMRAGGVGLTLTAASHVFMMDPCLNPAISKQAEDRVHRLGQKNPVFIKHMIATDTIEGTIYKIAQEKLNGGVLAMAAAAGAGAAARAPSAAGVEAMALESNELERLFANVEPEAAVAAAPVAAM
jgi:SNF2 family DNA or RNA helicase